MKTTYILKTSNDLTFEFGANELIWDYWVGEKDYVRRIFDRVADFPKKVMIDDVDYTINYFSKVYSV